MKLFYKAIVSSTLITFLNYLILHYNVTLWDVNWVSLTGLIAGILFILTMVYRSALIDYKEADKRVCTAAAKISSMHDVNINGHLNPEKSSKYNPKKMSEHLIKLLQELKKYLEGKIHFVKLLDDLNGTHKEFLKLDKVIPANKGARFLQFLGDLRTEISYLEYAKSLYFPRVGYVFLYFFILTLIVLQMFTHTESVMLQLIFIFSLSTILFFFADLVHDLDRPFKRKKAAFKIDLAPIAKEIASIKHSLKK
ncbi:hypothetical protein HOE67_04785 [Candidatus Peregrinibacteria bacterium]|jgi:hypothetical protein|nr:hypothetical protein [Candidatus Peregrinibacteria bacterium]MBT4056396.1 hypothetical protein [Candidatus Peregrinibacteria bacterium]